MDIYYEDTFQLLGADGRREFVFFGKGCSIRYEVG